MLIPLLLLLAQVYGLSHMDSIHHKHDDFVNALGPQGFHRLCIECKKSQAPVLHQSFEGALRDYPSGESARASFNALRIINGPTADDTVYGLEKKAICEGISDVSLEDGFFEVKATADAHLGGEDFDNCIVDFCMQDFKRKDRDKDLVGNKSALRHLCKQYERAKRTLPASTGATIMIDSLFDDAGFSCSLSHARFEESNNGIDDHEVVLEGGFARNLKVPHLIQEFFKGKEPNEVALEGGFARNPKVQHLIQEFFKGKEPNRPI